MEAIALNFSSALLKPKHDSANLFFNEAPVYWMHVPNQHTISKTTYLRFLKNTLQFKWDSEFQRFVEAVESTEFRTIRRDNLEMNIKF